MVSHHSAELGGQRQFGSGDIMVLVCHVILQDNVTKESCNFMDESPLRSVTILLSLIWIGTVVLKI